MRALHCLLGLLGLAVTVSCHLEEDYYVPLTLENAAYCFTLLNGTHQFGCASSRWASHGVVVKIGGDKDLDGLESCWRERFAGYSGHYYLYIDAALLQKSAVERIRRSSCVLGLLLYKERVTGVSLTAPLSDEGSCPNGQASYYKDGCGQTQWNERYAIFPEGMMHLNWAELQIVYIGEKQDRRNIEKCISLFNEPTKGSKTVSYPFCATQIDNKQFAAGNTEICLRRSSPDALMLDLRLEGVLNYCDPLSGYNIFTFVPPPVQKKGEKAKRRAYLMVAARLDSYGLIPAVSPADFSVFTSVISILAMQKTIGTHWELFEAASNRSNKHVLVAYLNGESFDYIGSSHLMYLIKNDSFPDYGREDTFSSLLAGMSPSELEAVIEPQQIGTTNDLTILMDQADAQTPTAQSLVKALQGGNSSSQVKTDAGRMPPSSWHHLKRINKKAVGVVLAPFGQKGYSFGQLNSMLDHRAWTPKERADVERRITRTAEALLRVSADYIGLNETEVESMRIDGAFVHDLFECLVISQSYNCSLIRQLQNFTGGGDIDYKSTYVGVNARDHAVAKVVYPLSIYAIGSTAHTKNVKDEDQCKDIAAKTQIYHYNWLGDYKTKKSYCYRHAVSVTQAMSPAFLIEDYDMKSGEYSTYTESVFSDMKMKIFLLQKDGFEFYMLLMGAAAALLSFLVIYRCEERTFIVDEGEPAAEAGEPL